MGVQQGLEGVIAIVIMIFMLPVEATAIAAVTLDDNLSAIPGLVALLGLVVIVTVFVIILMAVSLIKKATK